MNTYIHFYLLLGFSFASLIAMDPTQTNKSLSQLLRDALSIGLVAPIAIDKSEEAKKCLPRDLGDLGVVVPANLDLVNLAKKESLGLDDLLLVATQLGLHEEIDHLLNKGANPLVQTEIRKETPLMLAARNGYLPCVQKLLAVKGAEQINVTNKWGFAALDMAACEGSYDLIPELVNAGAQVNRCPSPLPEDKLNKKGEYPYLPPLLIARYENKTGPFYNQVISANSCAAITIR